MIGRLVAAGRCARAQAGRFGPPPRALTRCLSAWAPASTPGVSVRPTAHHVAFDDDEAPVQDFAPSVSVPETVHDLLQLGKGGDISRFVASVDLSVDEALSQLIDNRITSLLAVGSHGEVMGLVTERDILRALATRREGVFNMTLRELMTPAGDLLFATPDMTLTQCSVMMTERKVRNLPVIVDNSVKGLITLRHLSWAAHRAVLGLKDTAMQSMKVRGISPDVSVALAAVEAPRRVKLIAGLAEAPNPTKRDPVSEDAGFVLTLPVGESTVTYAGVADGVGSWREFGVDPSLFSSKLMEEVQNCVLDQLSTDGKPPAVSGVLHSAWTEVLSQEIVGSSTACILSLDVGRSQLQGINVGDSGFITLRPMSIEQKGSLVPLGDLSANLTVQYRSTQQLHDFNLPFQLGYAPGEDNGKFETPVNGDLVRVPVEAGDVVVMGTDGVFDNMRESEIHRITSTWYKVHGSTASVEDCTELAQELVDTALKRSLDRNTDSPFAVLAKENDIMWSGGAPDDITVIVGVVVPEDTPGDGLVGLEDVNVAEHTLGG